MRTLRQIQKAKIEQAEREQMANTLKRVRHLSRTRSELIDATFDSFEDSSSDSEQTATETDSGTVIHLLSTTPISSKLGHLSDYSSQSDVDKEDIASDIDYLSSDTSHMPSPK